MRLWLSWNNSWATTSEDRMLRFYPVKFTDTLFSAWFVLPSLQLPFCSVPRKSYPCKQTLNVLKDLNYWFPEANDIGKSAAKAKAVVLEAVNRRLVAVMIPMTPKNTCGMLRDLSNPVFQSSGTNNLSVLDLCQTSRGLIFSHKQSDACAKALIMTQRAS